MRLRWNPTLALGVLLAAVASRADAGVFGPGPNSTTIPSTGQSLSIVISAPTDGATIAIPPGTGTLIGNVSIGGLAGNPINVVTVVDVSGSTGSPSGQDCDGSGAVDAGDDLNADGTVGDTLDCEVAGILGLGGSLGNAANVDVAIVGFGSSAAVADMSPAAGSQAFAAPISADAQPNGVADVVEVARSLDQGSIGLFSPLSVGSSTDFNDALAAMLAAFASQPAGETNVAFFLSDGAASVSTAAGSPLQQAAAAGIVVNTFSVGGSATGCGDTAALRTIADVTGGVCIEVADPSQLSAALPGITPALLDRVEVDGVTVATDALGGFSSPIACSSEGPVTLTATAFASDPDQTQVSADVMVTCGTGQPAEVCDDRADNDGDGLADCADPDCTSCAPIVRACSHPCPSRLRTNPGPRLDAVELHLGFAAQNGVDPPNEAFSLVLSNANGVVFSGSLPPGSLRNVGRRAVHRDVDADTAGGFDRVIVRTLPSGLIRVDLVGYADLSGASLATMTLELVLGDDQVSATNDWVPKQRGWQLDLP